MPAVKEPLPVIEPKDGPVQSQTEGAISGSREAKMITFLQDIAKINIFPGPE